ncbi:transposase [Nocardia goodfellowii]|uniref:Transposase n=1 Tax=Nocardia goodfellowii TaxID=882446 RepID=A0ABS4QEP7_9NOCA|nr:transposase [Nocardia goodfellowii]MBP2190171.1 transposase [Nocardia goodfellowii]
MEWIEDLETIDLRIKTADKELRRLVLDRGSALMDLHGNGPSSAASLFADTNDIHRFANRDRFGSWNGTAPLDASSGEQQRHRLSRAGNRKINRVLHIMAVVQLRHRTAGRAYYDARKAGGRMQKGRQHYRRAVGLYVRRRMEARTDLPRGQAPHSVQARLDLQA